MRRRRGVVLLDVLIAVAILGIAGVSAVRFAIDASVIITRTRAAEAELRRASAFLEIVSLWTVEDLDRRLGERDQGPWRLRIERPRPGLYLLSLRNGTTGVELLRTARFIGRESP